MYNETDVTEGYKVTESNAKKLRLNKVIPPLNKVPSCEEQLTEIRKKISRKIHYFHK